MRPGSFVVPALLAACAGPCGAQLRVAQWNVTNYQSGRVVDFQTAILHGCNSPTEKRGQLNPEFVCWLMGFPTEWENCAPTGTPSTRKPRRPS